MVTAKAIFQKIQTLLHGQHPSHYNVDYGSKQLKFTKTDICMWREYPLQNEELQLVGITGKKNRLSS